jgi:pimeloyl-ACP methyl ester carboxylesterase
MAPRRRIGKKLVKSLLPILLVVTVAVVIAIAAVVYGVTRPPRRTYLVTPEAYSQISGPVLKVSDEFWPNPDGTKARGWLLRGAEGAPAVIFLHRYGADRSWLFNLGVKLNETAGYTILWPDLRGHGLTPPVGATTFGASEADDALGAIEYLRSLKNSQGSRLIGARIGLYGVELGGYAALRSAPKDPEIKALVLDSVPASGDELLRAVVRQDYEINNQLFQSLTKQGTRIYLLGKYQSVNSCDVAAQLTTQKILLLSGEEAAYLRDSTNNLARCFPNQANIELKTDLPLTGLRLPSATGEQGEGYDRRVIDFFDRNLR